MTCKYRLHPDFSHYEDFLQNIPSLFASVSSNIHKARNELKILTLDNSDFVVKSFKVPHLLNKIVYTFLRSSKARKSYEYSLKIINFVPKPVGFIEFYKYGLLNESYFISERFDYDFTIREPLLDASFEQREEVMRAFARFTLELHQNDIFHNDYSPGNILIKKENGSYVFKIVDINRMKFAPLSQKERAKNFSKLWAHDALLKIIADEYAKHYKVDAYFTDQVLYYSNQNKKIKNFKKRLKGQEVKD